MSSSARDSNLLAAAVRWPAIGTGLAAAALAIGCGGDGDDSGAQEGSTDAKAQFIRDADPICARLYQAIDSVDTSGLNTATGEPQALEEMATLVQVHVSQLENLDPPPADQELIGEWLAHGREQADVSRQIAEAWEASDRVTMLELAPELTASAGRFIGIAEGYGLSECGGDP